MSALERHRRQSQLREAEGYLELATACDERSPLSAELRNRMVLTSLEILARLEITGWRKSHVLFLTGTGYKMMHRYRDAIEPLRAASDLDPENLRIWLALGWCYKRLGRLDLAIQSLEEGLAADPSSALIYYNLSCYWALAHNAKLAVMYLAQAFDIDTNFRDRVPVEPDFDAIRRDPEFQLLTNVGV